jgi:hypothetical protein
MSSTVGDYGVHARDKKVSDHTSSDDLSGASYWFKMQEDEAKAKEAAKAAEAAKNGKRGGKRMSSRKRGRRKSMRKSRR